MGEHADSQQLRTERNQRSRIRSISANRATYERPHPVINACSPIAGLMLANGNTNFGGRVFGAGLPFACLLSPSPSPACDIPSDKSVSGASCSTTSRLGTLAVTATFRAAVRMFRMGGRLFSGEVLGPVSRHTPSPVDGPEHVEREGVWYGVVWHGMVRYGKVRCDSIHTFCKHDIPPDATTV